MLKLASTILLRRYSWLPEEALTHIHLHFYAQFPCDGIMKVTGPMKKSNVKPRGCERLHRA